jgi:hypothetical protein
VSLTSLPGFPDPRTIPIIRHRYRTPEGDFPRVTTVLKVLGLGTDALMRWAAEIEKKSAVMAAVDVYAEGKHGEGPAEFALAIEERLGSAKQHVVELAKAAEIGTATHEKVKWDMKQLLGVPAGPEPPCLDRSLWAWMAFDTWWKASGLKVLASEQPIYDTTLKVAGTLDIYAEDERGRPGIVDLKTSKYIYAEHHLQVAAYCHLARNFVPVEWAKIVRVPKKIDDPEFEVVELGKLYDRTLTEEQLIDAFRAAMVAWKTLILKPEA